MPGVHRRTEVSQSPAIPGHSARDQVVVLALIVVRATGAGAPHDHRGEEAEGSRIGAGAKEPDRFGGEVGPEVAPAADLARRPPHPRELAQRQTVHEGVGGVGRDHDPVPGDRNLQEAEAGGGATRGLGARHRSRRSGDVDLAVAQLSDAPRGPREANRDPVVGPGRDERLGHRLRERVEAAGTAQRHHPPDPVRGAACREQGDRRGDQDAARSGHAAMIPGAHGRAPPGAVARLGDGAAGIVNAMVVPAPRALRARASPPMLDTRWRTIARPSPVPPSSRERAVSTR